jgi:hemoglobin
MSEEIDERPLYEQMGGEQAIQNLVRAFYLNMETLPEALEIRQMHPDSLKGSEEKLFEFLSGWTGGPQLFIEKHGHPRLRARHLPFKIDESARDQWLLCFYKALDDCKIEGSIKKILVSSIGRLADHMRNVKNELA